MSHSFYDLRIGMHALGLRIFLKNGKSSWETILLIPRELPHFLLQVPQRTAATRTRGQYLVFNIRGVS